MAAAALTTRVALVTGASRGAGKGIALALGDAGMTVWVTGRSAGGVDTGSGLPGSLEATAAEITARGGRGVVAPCDHTDDASVAGVLDRIRAKHGRLDLLVNNVFAVDDALTRDRPFWEQPAGLDVMFEVGLRSTYVASRLAAPLLIASDGGSEPGPGGLIVNTSGFGGACYMHGPAYGAVKAGVDKMAHDMAVDLAPYEVAAVSIWMGLLRTERTMRVLDSDPARYAGVDATMESPEFTGRVIAALAESPNRMGYSGRVLVGAELGAELGVEDVDGRTPASRRPLLGDPPTFSSAVVR